ncbi:hypothetical protein GCM10017557_04160 [Streptomyces aurantiacus]|uniref:Uncharacterized protein n=1 Tax=Streptomyces aurantiacus TaxID=47760 RepID=A0A7G1NVD5_9ACTN|nr:hypothetical protein GCM10017557_04160 [Streptomyces aurantiacus]
MIFADPSLPADVESPEPQAATGAATTSVTTPMARRPNGFLVLLVLFGMRVCSFAQLRQPVDTATG